MIDGNQLMTVCVSGVGKYRHAAYGAAIYNERGVCVYETGQHVPDATFEEAALHGVIQALRQAYGFGGTRIVVIANLWEATTEAERDLESRMAQEMAGFEQVQIRHMCAAGNAVTYRLATAALA